MIEAGSAQAVMGNHEFNAIAWATSNESGGFLRPHTEKNEQQHRAFLAEIGEGSDAHLEAVLWFKTLPLWLDLGGLRVVHACWHANSQSALSDCLDQETRLTEEGLLETNVSGTAAYRAAEILLKGPEVTLPEGHSLRDKDGHLRREARLRWWDAEATTFRTAALGIEGREAELPDGPVPLEFMYRDPEPVLFGHYWLTGEPYLLTQKASCLDFSVANGGFLTAYRWSGETELQPENLVRERTKA
jgi:hypothetical protein